MRMKNAKDEVLEALAENDLLPRHVQAATIKYSSLHSIRKLEVTFTAGKDEDGFEAFLNRNLNFSYDSGYGGQELEGIIWMWDGETWFERGEYDGSEWWEYKKRPPLP